MFIHIYLYKNEKYTHIMCHNKKNPSNFCSILIKKRFRNFPEQIIHTFALHTFNYIFIHGVFYLILI